MKKHVSEPQERGNSGRDLSSGFLDVQDIAEYLKVRVSTVYFLVEQKKVPHYRIGRQIRFKRSEVDGWMGEQREEVVDIRVRANKVFRSIEKNAELDINTIIKKTVDDVRGRRYTSSQEKPGRIKGLGKEVQHGIV